MISDTSIAFNIGYADTMHGIKTFPARGTDRARDLTEWKQQMLVACQTCQDKDYAAGVKKALETLG